MLTFLTWAVGAYCVVWVAAAVFLYCMNRKYSTASSRRSRDAWVAALLGLVWPAVLVQLALLAWQGLRSGD